MIRELTEDVIQEATTKRGRQQTFIWDKATKGLGLRVTKTGLKRFVYRWSENGKDRRVTIGRWPLMSLEEAIEEAVSRRLQGNPEEEDGDDADPGEKTMADLWRRFNETHLHRRDPDDPENLIPRRSSGHIRNCRDQFERLIIPYFGSKPVAEVTWQDVRDWHDSLADTPTQANRALAALRVALKKARRWDGWNLTGPNPAVDHELHTEKKSGRTFTDREWETIGETLLEEEDPILIAAATVYLISGLRPGEVCDIRWEDLEEGGVLFLEEAKTGPRRANLSTRAERVIDMLPRVGGYVCPGRSPDAPIGGDSRPHGFTTLWKRVRRKGDVGRPYLARHSWVTAAAEAGIGDDIRRLLSGHASANGSAHGTYLHNTPRMKKAADTVAEALAARFDADKVEERISELLDETEDPDQGAREAQ